MSQLDKLPQELATCVGNHLTTHDLAQFSATCHGLRVVLAPSLFKTLKWSTQDNDTSSIELAARGHAEDVRRLVFTFVCDYSMLPYIGTIKDQRSLSKTTDFVGKITTLGLPKLDNVTVEVHFKLKFFEQSMKFTFIKNGNLLGNHNMWLAAYELAWNELIKNKGLKCLVLLDMPPAALPSSDTATEFLNNLEHLDISIFGVIALDKNKAWVESVCNRADYQEGLRSLEPTLFTHLQNLESLTLTASAHAPIGAVFQSGFPIAPHSMPNLKTLRLASFIISQELVSFVNAHRDTLTTLTLSQCHARDPIPVWMREEPPELAEDDEFNTMVWSQFFQSLGKNGAVLSAVSVLPEAVLTTWEEAYNRGIIDSASLAGDPHVDTSYMASGPDDDMVEAVQAMRREHPQRKLFSYYDVDMHQGLFWYPRREANCHHFLKGKDDAAFVALQRRLKSNKDREARRRIYGIF